MDTDRFDAWTRSLGSPGPRRGVLRLLLGGALGGALAPLGGAGAAVCRDTGARCQRDGQCCSGVCRNGACRCPRGVASCSYDRCLDTDAECAGDGQCCSGVCRGGACRCPRGVTACSYDISDTSLVDPG